MFPFPAIVVAFTLAWSCKYGRDVGAVFDTAIRRH